MRMVDNNFLLASVSRKPEHFNCADQCDLASNHTKRGSVTSCLVGIVMQSSMILLSKSRRQVCECVFSKEVVESSAPHSCGAEPEVKLWCDMT